MWGKRSEIGRLKALRKAAHEALGGVRPNPARLEICLRIQADPRLGDLDNFITGVCDGLMAAHARTPVPDGDWMDVPDEIHPRHAIVYQDDSCVWRINAKRIAEVGSQPCYEVGLTW